jgi:hypothetical protein
LTGEMMRPCDKDHILAVVGTILWPPFGPFPSHLTNWSEISSDCHTHILAGDQKRKHKLAACCWRNCLVGPRTFDRALGLEFGRRCPPNLLLWPCWQSGAVAPLERNFATIKQCHFDALKTRFWCCRSVWPEEKIRQTVSVDF